MSSASTPAQATVVRRRRTRVAAPPSATTWRFYVCFGLLLGAAGALYGATELVGGYFSKSELPLKRPFHLMDVSKLAPEYVLHPQQPPPLNKELIDSLGTDEYLQWRLVDTTKDSDDPTATARLFITYYTGKPDLVPHNPRECLAAAGMVLEEADSIEVQGASWGARDDEIPVDVLTFGFPGQSSKTIAQTEQPKLVVAYFFYANGRYVTSRNGVRTAVNTIRDRYAYYAKIEMNFVDRNNRTLANATDTKAATRKLLDKLMPILWQDHFQDWEAIRAGAAPQVGGAPVGER